MRSHNFGFLCRRQREFLPITRDEAGQERWLLLARVLAELGLEAPVLDRHERFDLPLALDDQAHRHGLHPPGR